MQIREMSLKELYDVYDLVVQLHCELSYDEFEDLIYDMRERYKMFGILEKEELVAFAGVSIETNLSKKRYILIHDLVTDHNHRGKGYARLMLEFINDYAKTASCHYIMASAGVGQNSGYNFYENAGFLKTDILFLKHIQ
jgi:GNAT superfamily N-acetyltransferase